MVAKILHCPSNVVTVTSTGPGSMDVMCNVRLTSPILLYLFSPKAM